MPRKTEIVTPPDIPGTSNRDRGKKFLITEWDAERADNWWQHMVLAFNHAGGALPPDLKGIGFEGIAILGINTFLRGNILPDVIIPLMDRLLECVKMIRDPSQPHISSDIVSADDIEEVATRWWLRSEVVRIHTGFSPAAVLSALATSILAKTAADSSTT